MKTTVILTTLAATIFCLSGCSKSDNVGIGDMSRYDGYLYDGRNEKQMLEIIPNKHFIIFKKADTRSVLQQLKDKGFTVVDSTYMVYTLDIYDLYVPEILQDCMCTDINGTGNLEEISDLVYNTHLYYTQDKELPKMQVGASNVFYVGVDSEEDLDLVEEYARKVNAYVIRESFGEIKRSVTVVCTNASAGTHVQLANWLHSTGKFAWVMPEMMDFIWT